MLITLILFSSATVATSSAPPLPSADDVVAKIMQHDQERQAALAGYTARRRYVLENQRHHKRAEMLVRVRYLQNGSKEFDIVSSDGSAGIRKHIFPRLLSEETEASRPGHRERSRIVPDNYSFRMVGTDTINGRHAYVIALNPKTSNKYLMDGKIWVDAEEYAIVRIEGQPAKNPSFWIKSVRFVHSYAKQGPFWFPSSDNSITDVRVFGNTELKIDYFDYSPEKVVITASGAAILQGLQ
jgi:hypothetical protein